MKPYGFGDAIVLVGLSVLVAVLLGPRWWIVPALYVGGTVGNWIYYRNAR